MFMGENDNIEGGMGKCEGEGSLPTKRSWVKISANHSTLLSVQFSI